MNSTLNAVLSSVLSVSSRRITYFTSAIVRLKLLLPKREEQGILLIGVSLIIFVIGKIFMM